VTGDERGPDPTWWGLDGDFTDGNLTPASAASDQGRRSL